MATTKWNLDPAHSEVEFRVRHLMIANISGRFDRFDATAETDGDDFMSAKGTFTIEAGSINTSNEQRDGHLKSADFFDVEKFPGITFVPKTYDKLDVHGNFKVTGDLTVRDVTHPVTLDGEFGGIIKDPFGGTRAGVVISGRINRKQFGLTYHAVTEAGGIVISDEVRLSAGLQFVKAQ